MTPSTPTTRRVTITLRKWPFVLYFGLRPTIVIEGRGQPTQWGTGTWQLPADRDATVEVFLHRAGFTYGRATFVLDPSGEPSIEYRAPALVFLPAAIGHPAH